jgi:Na+/proline symporter
MDLQLLVRLAGIAVLDVILLYITGFYYDKNKTISLVSLLVAAVITLAYVLSTLYFKKICEAQQKKQKQT